MYNSARSQCRSDESQTKKGSTKLLWFLRQLPLLIWMGVMILTLILWQGLLTHERDEVTKLLYAKTVTIQNVITTQVENRIRGLIRMAHRWEIRGGIPQSEWEADAQAYMKDYRGFQAIEWVDSSFWVRWVVPLIGNEAAKNFYLGFEPRRLKALETARDRQEVTLTHAIELVQGGKGFLSYIPIFKNQEFDGFILGVFRYEPLFNSILNQTFLNGCAFILFDNQEQIYSHNANIQKYRRQWQQAISIHLREVTWTLQIWPTPSLIDQVQSSLPTKVFIGGLLSACLLSSFVYFAQTAWFRAQVVERMNHKLTYEIRERQQAEEALLSLTQKEREKAIQLEVTLQELKQAQAHLVHNEKMISLGQMVAGVAHEINNPTSFIYGNINPASEYVHDLLYLLQLYRKHYPEPVAEISEQLAVIEPEFIAEDFPKLLTSMQEGADRIRQIVLALRNFSRLDEAKLKEADIHQGIDNTLLILQHRLKQQPDRCEIQVIKKYGQLPLVMCYPGELNQVFMNILSNAIDALEMGISQSQNLTSQPPTPTIWIYTSVLTDFSPVDDDQSESSPAHIEHKDKSCLVVRIANNGPTIPPEVQKQIFDPFFTTKPTGRGTGLGLSISYRIVVDRHGGVITCHSDSLQGTEFAIKLPIIGS